MRYLEIDELNILRDAAPAMYRLMITLAFNHGLRISETLSLTRANFKGGYLIIQRLKGSEKTVQKVLPDEQALLANYIGTLTGSDEKLFPISRQAAWKMMKKLGLRNGVPAHKCSNHALKHTCAIAGLRGGMKINEVQKRLGHKSGASTMMYLKIDDETADRAFEKAMGLS